MLIAGFFPDWPVGRAGKLDRHVMLAFVIVCFGVMALRYSRPNIPRPFRTPLVPLVPILGILICGYLMVALPSDTWIRLIVWMANQGLRDLLPLWDEALAGGGRERRSGRLTSQSRLSFGTASGNGRRFL